MSENLPQKSHFLVYQADDGTLKIDVRLEDETVWLPQQLMADLFQTTQQNISQHIKAIYEEGELDPAATHKKFLSVRREGSRQVRRELDHYNLDMIISVGYRVKSHVATRFRIWATQRLTEYVVKGFTMDDERLKNPDHPFDYFDELLRRIQDIRTSERRFYQKITDIYATARTSASSLANHQYAVSLGLGSALTYRKDGESVGLGFLRFVLGIFPVTYYLLLSIIHYEYLPRGDGHGHIR